MAEVCRIGIDFHTFSHLYPAAQMCTMFLGPQYESMSMGQSCPITESVS
jgi:hypothetical protein